MVDGKVTFKQTLEAPSLSKEQLYNLLLNWSDQYFKPNEKLPQHRVVYTNQDKGEIVAMGEEYIVFLPVPYHLTGHESTINCILKYKTGNATLLCHASGTGMMKTEMEDNGMMQKNGLPMKWP